MSGQPLTLRLPGIFIIREEMLLNSKAHISEICQPYSSLFIIAARSEDVFKHHPRCKEKFVVPRRRHDETPFVLGGIKILTYKRTGPDM